MKSVIFLFLFMLIFSCQNTDDKIVIGNYGSMTGAEATFGISTRDGIVLAIEEQNAQGGLLGKKIELKSYDNQGKPEEARLNVEKLINIDNVVAIIGEVASTRSLAGAPVAQQYKVPMISPSSTDPSLTEMGDYIFRICFIDPFQGEVMAKFARNSLKFQKAAILRDSKSDYSMGLAKYFIKTFTELGGEVVSDEKYVSGDVDFKAQLTSIKSKRPDFIFIPGYYTEVGLLARQAREQGLTVPLLGGDGWDSDKLVEIGGLAIQGSYFSNHYTSEDPRSEVQNFIKNFEKRFKRRPDALSASGYDSARILFKAIDKAQTREGKPIRDALAQTKDFSGVTGKITINEKRNASKPAVVLQVKDKKFTYIESVSP